MPYSTAKRVVLYRFDRQPTEGIVNPGAYLLDDHIEAITLNGSLQNTRYAELKALCFVSESGGMDLFSSSPFFERRPKVPGLWTRFTFRDGDRLDGILPHNLLDWPQAGYMITPPKAGAARQRVFIPRLALVGTELRGVVGRSALAVKRGTELEQPDTQINMFEL